MISPARPKEKPDLSAVDRQSGDDRRSADDRRLQVLGTVQSRIAYTIGRLERAVRQRLAQVTGRFGLTVAQYTALSVLDARGSLSNAQLARRCFVTPQAMNEIVAAMARRNIIAREPDAQHGRIVRISLTRRGKEVLRRCDAAAGEVEEVMLAELPRAKRALLLQMLQACVTVLERDGPPRPG